MSLTLFLVRITELFLNIGESLVVCYILVLCSVCLEAEGPCNKLKTCLLCLFSCESESQLVWLYLW